MNFQLLMCRAQVCFIALALIGCNGERAKKTRGPASAGDASAAPAVTPAAPTPKVTTGSSMTRTVEQAVSDLSTPDGILRDQTIALLVSYGTRATAALLPLLDRNDVELRSRATRVLAYIADPSTADRLAKLLDDSNPFIRSHAAYGLFSIRDPRALEALIKTIDDFPTATMYPASQSTGALATIGPSVLPRVAELLTASSPDTRARARLVIVQIANGLPPKQAAAWRARVAQSRM